MPRRLVGLVLADRIARPHSAILSNGEPVGEITSGSRAPSLEANIALGYVPTALSKTGTRLQVDIRGKLADAVVSKTPFYTRPY